MMKVKEVSELAGVSVRTLHHYDEIGLLTPEHATEAGYRLYSDRDLETLQQILFFRELDLPLKQIKDILQDPTFDPKEALELHRKMLLEKRRRIDKVLDTLEKTIRQAKGEIHMSNQEKFEGFDFSNNPYEQEARERWGDEAVDASKKKLGGMSQDERKAMEDGMNAIYRKLAALRHDPADSDEAQAAIKEWYDFLNGGGFGHHYSLEAFKGLGQMYVDDERFTRNIDKFGDGLATFMRDAMAVYADRNA
jgi:DNA-binding transcriptional MerR regulator